MNKQTVKLIDQSRNLVGVAQVSDEGAYFGGTIDLAETPSALRALFDEFEEIVNGQMLSFLDAIQERLAAPSPRAVFDTGREAYVRDLQVFPSTRDVSFKLAGVPASSVG